ncbi:MAG TPA: hypothetical protein VGZ03_04075 [Acidimicrobiales bacterium]|jgi:hypothetical protein|nr:hypothetical protein [Acidimicrobiales bacterium]
MPSLRRGPKASAPGDAGGGVDTLLAPGPDGPPPEAGRSRRRYDPAWDEWERPRRWPGVLITCAVVLGFLGVVVWHYRPTTAPAHTHKAQKAFNGLPSGAFVPAGPTETFRGTHNRAGIAFTSNGHLLVLHASCLCTYNFAVTIFNAGAVPVAPPIANSGNSNVTLNEMLPAGGYKMSILGSGPWEIQLIRPNASVPLLASRPGHPFAYDSAGPSVLGPFSSADRFLYLKYLGIGNIYVYVLDPNGNRIDTAFFGRAFIKHGVALPNPPDHYYVEVDASTGFWKLLVQHSAKG